MGFLEVPQRMNREQIRDFFFKEGLIYFDAAVNPLFDLKKHLPDALYRRFAESEKVDLSLNRDDALENLKLKTPEGMTNAGALVLAAQCSKFIISATINCVLFQGNTKEKILDQKVYDGSLAENYHNGLQYFHSHLNTEYIITSVRQEKLELPEAVLREALINAIVHHDYRSPAEIQVCIYHDRIEIVNPGGLVGGLTLKDLGRKSIPRNSLLFGTLHRMGLVERIGSGLHRIQRELHEYGLKAPLIEAGENWFSITFFRKRAGPENAAFQGSPEYVTEDVTENVTEDVTEGVTENVTEDRRRSLIAHIRQEMDISINKLAAQLGVSRRTIIRDIDKLKHDGRLRRIGPDKGGHWEVVDDE